MQNGAAIEWGRVKAVVFDVDGTLYAQSILRRQMLYALLTYYAVRPWRLREMLILHHFRAERERRSGEAGGGLENAQYAWCAEKTNEPAGRVKAVVQRWIFDFPLRYLPGCTYPGTRDFFDALRQRDIKIAIYSDYRAEQKLAAMGLRADLVVSSTDAEVDRFKPDPRGLLVIARKLGLQPEECLFIGDRPELDGACAENAGVPYLIVDKQPFKDFDFYRNLQSQLNPLPKQPTYEPDTYPQPNGNRHSRTAAQARRL